MGGAFYSFAWTSIGTLDGTAAAADGALAVTERTAAFVDALDNGVVWDIPHGVNALEARFIQTTNSDNMIMDIWMGKRAADGTADLCRMCTLDVECGTQDHKSSATGLHYADEATLSNEAWAKDLQVIQSGNDTELMVRLYIADTCGYDVIAFHGHTTATGNRDCEIEVAGWSSFFE
jgi:hypothetical protein